METKYFNNAGAGLMSQKTYNSIDEHLQLEMKIGAYKAATVKANSISQFYNLSAQLFGAEHPEEIAFIDSASRGWNLVMYGINITSKDVIITLASEYGTNLLTIYDIAYKTGCSVKVIPCDDSGRFSIDDVEKEIKSGGTVLAVSHVAAQGSIVNPVLELGRLANKYGIIYVVDGCQAVGQIPINVKEIGCNAYVTAGRKWLRGPRGTGVLYVKSGSPIRSPQIDLASSDLVFDQTGSVCGLKIREDAKQFELWEKSTASVLGLNNAIFEYLHYGEEKASSEIIAKSNIIRKCISQNKNLHLVGMPDSITGVSSFYLRDSSQEEYVKNIFDTNNIIISLICDWDCPVFFPKGINYIFRISPHYYTSKKNIEEICSVIDGI